MKTKTRLSLLLGAMLLLVSILAVVSLATIWRLRSEGMAVIKANYDSVSHMQAMHAVLDTVQDAARRQALLGELLAKQKTNITEHMERPATEALAKALDSLAADPAAVLPLRRAMARVFAVNLAAIESKALAQQELADRAVVWISFTATFAFLLAFTLFLSTPGLVVAPIRVLTEGIDRIASGHYDERITLNSKDEFGHLATRFNSMAAELQRWSNSNLSRIMAEKNRAEAVINSLRYPSIGVDEHQHILFMNHQAGELLGLDPGELVGMPVEEAGARNDLLAHILRSGGSTTFKAVLEGREQQFTVENSPISSGAERAGIVYTLYNVTPYLERDQAKTMFLATISHEMKTPLASTDIGLGLLERQQATRLTADQAAILSDLRKDHQRLVRIVSELLDMAQAETGRVRVSVAEHELSAIVHEAAGALQATAQARDILVEIRLKDHTQTVMADMDKATWSLINLLSNALRHAPRGSSVTIGSNVEDGHVQLCVADAGPGLAPDQLEHLFERFVPHATNGTGLGLSIAKELMRAMGGDITYRPGDPSGAVFCMHFADVPVH